jgi:hypothetical protein
VKRFIAALAQMALLAALLGTGQVFAQGYGRPGFPGKGPGPGPQPMPAKQMDRERGGPPPGRPAERMSPEERRDLRRDIEQHGREIYPDPRRGPGRR